MTIKLNTSLGYQNFAHVVALIVVVFCLVFPKTEFTNTSGV